MAWQKAQINVKQANKYIVTSANAFFITLLQHYLCLE